MSTEEKNLLNQSGKPSTLGAKGGVPKPPTPPKRPEASSIEDDKGEKEMPNLDQFNFMKW